MTTGKPSSYAHDFFDVIDHHAREETRQKDPMADFFQTHPLEYGEDESKAASGGIYQTDKYDYIPRYQQFAITEEKERRELERLMQRILNGEGILRKEQTTTDPRGNFNVLVIWLERKEKKLKKKPSPPE